MVTFPVHDFLQAYWQDCFNLKQHLQEFLQLDAATVEAKFQTGRQDLADLGHRDFDWQQATAFYKDKVGETYLFELGIWHLQSQDYIGGTLKLIADHAKGRVLDFGGGIGTHAIAAALSPDVSKVVYCDINPVNRNFVEHRAKQLGLSHKLICCLEVPNDEFDTVISFDVLEHLPDPSYQLMQFHNMLSSEGKIILNWCFFKGYENEFPFHIDDPKIVETFFRTLQSNFLEIFHPYFITARCYRKLP